MSKWESENMKSKILAALETIQLSERNVDHHFGMPFVTAYQLAITLEKQNPGLTQTLEKTLGGKDIGEYHSLPQYVAQQLSRRIEDGSIVDIEGVFLSNVHIENISFKGEITSSISGDANEISMFRIKSVAEHARNMGFVERKHSTVGSRTW